MHTDTSLGIRSDCERSFRRWKRRQGNGQKWVDYKESELTASHSYRELNFFFFTSTNTGGSVLTSIKADCAHIHTKTHKDVLHTPIADDNKLRLEELHFNSQGNVLMSHWQKKFKHQWTFYHHLSISFQICMTFFLLRLRPWVYEARLNPKAYFGTFWSQTHVLSMYTMIAYMHIGVWHKQTRKIHHCRVSTLCLSKSLKH